MSISQPSKEVYVVEVPDCKDFEASFTYNYFEPSESVSEFAGIPLKYRQRPTEQRDASFQNFADTRVPRWVALRWSLPRLRVRGLFRIEEEQRGDQFDVAPYKDLIRGNLDKILSEEAFASENFVSLVFQDGQMDETMFFAASGSYVQHTIDEPDDRTDSTRRAALRASMIAPADVNPTFINEALAQPTLGEGIKYHKNVSDLRQNRRTGIITRLLRKVTAGAQINTRLLSTMLKQANISPSTDAGDFDVLRDLADSYESTANAHATDDVDDTNFKLYLPYVDGRVDESGSGRTPQRFAKLVGYIVDKNEVLSDGTFVEKDPIIIENPRVKETIDFGIRYNAMYTYQVRVIYMLTVPSIDEETGDVAILKILVSSRPTHLEYVPTTEEITPPPPTDINFTWDYRRLNREGKPGSLMIHWTFPPNPQRDIKRFQVYRRKSVEHAFELVKMYDFDDSLQQIPYKEEYDEQQIEYIDSPATWWYDDDFVKTSRFIYTVCSMDAHGYVSDYGAQFEIWFDLFENSIKKRLISHMGAPAAYPNLYIEQDLFVDTIRVSGEKSKTMAVYFNPEYYRLYDDHDKNIPVFTTTQDGGSYRLQFINMDNQKDQVLTISVDDIVKRTKAEYVDETIDSKALDAAAATRAARACNLRKTYS